MKKLIIVTAVLVGLVSGAQAQSLKDAGQAADTFIKQAQESLRKNPIFICVSSPVDASKDSSVAMITDRSQRAVILAKTSASFFGNAIVCGKGVGAIKFTNGITSARNEGYVTTVGFDGVKRVYFPIVCSSKSNCSIKYGTFGSVTVEPYRP